MNTHQTEECTFHKIALGDEFIFFILTEDPDVFREGRAIKTVMDGIGLAGEFRDVESKIRYAAGSKKRVLRILPSLTEED